MARPSSKGLAVGAAGWQTGCQRRGGCRSRPAIAAQLLFQINAIGIGRAHIAQRHNVQHHQTQKQQRYADHM